jgi:glutamyl-tRNA synthetase
MRRISVEDMTERVIPFLARAGYLSDVPPTDKERARLDAAMPLVAERINTLAESVDMLGFLFVKEDDFTRDPADVEKVLDAAGLEVVQASYDALSALSEEEWTTAAIEEALRAKLVEELGLKPRNAFGPVRVAVTGRRISPPLFESLELLGRDISLARHISARRP